MPNEKTPILRLGLDRARWMCQGQLLTGLTHPKAVTYPAIISTRNIVSTNAKYRARFQSSRPFVVGAGDKATKIHALTVPPVNVVGGGLKPDHTGLLSTG